MSKKANPYNLTDRQTRFCKEFIIILNGTQAAINAKYSKKTARETASKLLTKGNIQNYISELKEKTAKKLEITHEWITQQFKDLAINKDTRDNDRIKALENLAKHIGYFELHNDQKKIDLKQIIGINVK